MMLKLDKPVMNAAGTFACLQVGDLDDRYGAVVTKSITLQKREGNPEPTLVRTRHGYINSVGLRNCGVQEFLDVELAIWDASDRPVIVSIAGSRIQDYVQLCQMLVEDERVAAIELNLSCPNAYDFGQPFTRNPENVEIVVDACKAELNLAEDGKRRSLIVKLAAENAVNNALWAEHSGADAVTLINTIPALAFIEPSGKPFLGGLSGESLAPIALRCVYDVKEEVSIPIIGCGGLHTESGIKDMRSAGATYVQIGSAAWI